MEEKPWMKSRISSDIIAATFERKHDQVTRLIRKYRKYFEEFGCFCTEKIKTKGRSMEVYFLTEQQFLLLVTMFKNTPNVVKFKFNLAMEFKRARLEGNIKITLTEDFLAGLTGQTHVIEEQLKIGE